MTGDLLDPLALLGRWRLARVVEDRLVGAESRITGVLELSRVSAHRIGWEESGRWHQDTGDVDVRRGLWLERRHQEPAEQWWVLFEDGRDFHAWTPGVEVVHPCSPDTYTGLVRGTPDAWTVRWDVVGPRKDYTMTTVLTPEG